ncbi:MAG: rod shape-determining protein MreC [Omnitrophica WOR_2 bacterium RIFCSPHIGHO2_02_FULL_68_15]|nr:MAG: rod shape-determining protein MreC [Omnitrophica WOR_2 bacterium RIFCSPHIGHO2_02_FULL_68_15]
MRQSPRVALIGALLVGAFYFHAPLRHVALVVLRLPFTLVKGAVQALLLLPRLPGLADENAGLRAELVQRQMEASQLREALRRSEQGQALLDLIPERQGLTASVIGRSTLPAQQTVLLDRGARDGLSLDTVIVDASGLIGRVVELHPAACLVLLLTDPESRVAGLVERSRETGLLVGKGWGQCAFIYLDADADIQEGDRVVTAGLGGPFPKGLLLGTVVHVARDELTGSAMASVDPAARLSRLEEVLCVLPASTSAAPAAAAARKGR